MTKNEVPQHNGFVMSLISRRINKRNWTMPCKTSELIDPLFMLVQLSTVPPSKFLPANRIMSEPLSKRSAWSNILHPMINSRIGFPDSARPQPVNQDAHSVVGCWPIVRSL